MARQSGTGPDPRTGPVRPGPRPPGCSHGAGPRNRVHAVALAALLGGGCLYLWAFSPHDSSSVYPICPTKLVTGLDCPGCGALRMGHDLLRGDLVAAAHDNAFLLGLLPMLLGYGGWLAWQRSRGRAPGMPWRAIIVITVLAIIWGIVRNIPGFPLVPG